MAELHPSDIELLEYVEGDLAEADAQRVRDHVAACETCARELEESGRTRELLRSAPTLRLPECRLSEIVTTLPRQEAVSSDVRSFIRSKRRLFLVVTPAAAALAAVVIAFAVSSSGDESGQQEAGGAAAAQTAADGGAKESLEAAPTLDQAAPVVRVEGPPREIVRILREAGFSARRDSGTVIVTGAEAAKVKKALADRPRGSVPVVVTP
jgi:anti-sigma factor RsiW